MPNYAKVQEIRFFHREEDVNDYLRNGWVILCTPFIALRRVNDGQDGRYEPVDIPYTRVVLGRIAEKK